MHDNDGLHRRPNKPGANWYFGFRDPRTGKWREVSTKTSVFAEARRVKQSVLAEIESGIVPSNRAKMHLAAAADEWLAYRDLAKSENTRRIDRACLAPVKAFLGHLRLEEITIDMIRAYQTHRAKTAKNRTVNMDLQALRGVLKYFRQWRRFADDYKPLPESKETIGRVLSEEEEAHMWQVAQTAPHFMRVYNLSVLFGNTGLRRSELLGLRLENLDIEGRQILVQKSKTDAGIRAVPLNEHALAAARMLLERARECGASEPGHFLLPADLSKHTKATDPLKGNHGFDPTQPQKSFRTAWRHFTRECGLKGLRIHDRRHHFVTLLAENDVPVHVAMSIVGHMSPEMLRHYTHIRDRAKQEAVKAIEAATPAAPLAIAAGMAKPVKSAPASTNNVIIFSRR